MKTIENIAYNFNPSAGTLDLSAISNFSIRRLYAVINTTKSTIIYAVGTTNSGYSAFSNGVLTLQYNVSTMSSTDDLMIIYDDPNATQATLVFVPIKGATIALTAGPTSTTTPVALAAATATSYRIRNPSSSASPISWRLTTVSNDVAVIPVPYSTAGTGGTVGDKMIDPGGLEIIGLSPNQQAALAAGTLYFCAVTPAGGSGTLYITPGIGA